MGNLLSMELVIKRNHIPALIKALPIAAEFGLDHFAATVLQDAAAGAPVLSGGLRASRFRVTPLHNDWDTAVGAMQAANPKATPSERPEVGKQEAVFGFAADYARYVHDGHHTPSGSFVAGRPFLAEALSGSGGARAIARIIGTELTAMMGRL